LSSLPTIEYGYNDGYNISHDFPFILDYAIYNRFISSVQLIIQYIKEVEKTFDIKLIKKSLKYAKKLLSTEEVNTEDLKIIIQIIEEEYPLINTLESKLGNFFGFKGGRKTRRLRLKSKSKSKKSDTIKAVKK
jgi:hypothetical protein